MGFGIMRPNHQNVSCLFSSLKNVWSAVAFTCKKSQQATEAQTFSNKENKHDTVWWLGRIIPKPIDPKFHIPEKHLHYGNYGAIDPEAQNYEEIIPGASNYEEIDVEIENYGVIDTDIDKCLGIDLDTDNCAHRRLGDRYGETSPKTSW